MHGKIISGFGSKAGIVSVAWPAGAFGGMEHHPFSHVAEAAMDSEETLVHESAHGWFGDGIRIGCWEDFVLSEGGKKLQLMASDIHDWKITFAETGATCNIGQRLRAVERDGVVMEAQCHRREHRVDDAEFAEQPVAMAAVLQARVAP